MKLGLGVAAIALVLAGLYGAWVFPRPARAAVGELAFVETGDGARVAYYASGDGPRVVLLASLGRSVSDFNELSAALNVAGWRTVAVESRGVGRSTRPANDAPYSLYDLGDDIEAALVADGAASDERVHVIGHAFGNRVARAFASRRPARVDRIVLAASGGSQRLEDDPRALAALLNSFKWWLPPPQRRGDVGIAFFANDNPIPGYWMAGWNGDAARAQVAAVGATPVNEWRDAGGEAQMLIMQGAQDRIAPAESTSQTLQRDFADRVEVALIESAGHALLPEAPEDIARRVIAFLCGSPQRQLPDTCGSD